MDNPGERRKEKGKEGGCKLITMGWDDRCREKMRLKGAFSDGLLKAGKNVQKKSSPIIQKGNKIYCYMLYFCLRQDRPLRDRNATASVVAFRGRFACHKAY